MTEQIGLDQDRGDIVADGGVHARTVEQSRGEGAQCVGAKTEGGCVHNAGRQTMRGR